MTLYPTCPERWPQVSLKGCFVLVTVVGVSLGWFCVQMNWIQDRHSALKAAIDYRYSVDPTANLPFGLRLLHEPSVAVISIVTTPDEYQSRISQLQRLFPEADMNDAIEWPRQPAEDRDDLPMGAIPIYVHP